MFYGSWEYEAIPKIIANQIEAVEHRWIPDEDHKQGFEMIGSLSGMFSKFYRFATQDEGELAKLRLEITPGFLGNLIPKDYSRDVLPLWRFKLHPSESIEGEAAIDDLA